MTRNKKRVYEPGKTVTFRTRVSQTELVKKLNESTNVNDDILSALELFYFGETSKTTQLEELVRRELARLTGGGGIILPPQRAKYGEEEEPEKAVKADSQLVSPPDRVEDEQAAAREPVLSVKRKVDKPDSDPIPKPLAADATQEDLEDEFDISSLLENMVDI